MNDSDKEEKLPAPTQAQIDALMAVIDRVEKRRKTMLAGYLLSLVVLVGGQLLALYIFSQTAPDTFIGWIFLIPFAVVGALLWIFGRLTRAPRKPGP